MPLGFPLQFQRGEQALHTDPSSQGPGRLPHRVGREQGGSGCAAPGPRRLGEPCLSLGGGHPPPVSSGRCDPAPSAVTYLPGCVAPSWPLWVPHIAARRGGRSPGPQALTLLHPGALLFPVGTFAPASPLGPSAPPLLPALRGSPLALGGRWWKPSPSTWPWVPTVAEALPSSAPTTSLSRGIARRAEHIRRESLWGFPTLAAGLRPLRGTPHFFARSTVLSRAGGQMSVQPLHSSGGPEPPQCPPSDLWNFPFEPPAPPHV